MQLIEKVDSKIDIVSNKVHNIDKNLALHLQQNENDHKILSHRVHKLECNENKSIQIWQSFINSPIVAKAIVMIVFLILVGGSGVSLATFMGLL